jgi:hypothetical protein
MSLATRCNLNAEGLKIFHRVQSFLRHAVSRADLGRVACQTVEHATASFKDGKATALIDPEQTDRAAIETVLKERGVTLEILQATALVHDAYLRLVDVERAQHWNSRGHFFAAAAEAMRRILVDNARRKQSKKRGGNRAHLNLDQLAAANSEPVPRSTAPIPAQSEKGRPTQWSPLRTGETAERSYINPAMGAAW